MGLSVVWLADASKADRALAQDQREHCAWAPVSSRRRRSKTPRPVYPAGALSDQARGTVVVEATVGVDGKVAGARVIRSIPQLDEAALEAVRQWEFLPARMNGAPVAVIITVVVNFAIF